MAHSRLSSLNILSKFENKESGSRQLSQPSTSLSNSNYWGLPVGIVGKDQEISVWDELAKDDFRSISQTTLE